MKPSVPWTIVTLLAATVAFGGGAGAPKPPARQGARPKGRRRAARESPARQGLVRKDAVYGQLIAGRTIGQAVLFANTNFPPGHQIGPGTLGRESMEMKVKIDSYARLISVYTGDSSSPNRPLSEMHPGYYPYRWYLVNPQANP